MMQAAQVVASASWSFPVNVPGAEQAFSAISNMRSVLAAWNNPLPGRLVISVLVYEPYDETRLDVIEAILREFADGVERL